MAFTQKQAIAAVEAHGFSFIASADGKLKHKHHNHNSDVTVSVYWSGLKPHKVLQGCEEDTNHGGTHYSAYAIKTSDKNVSIFFNLEEIRVYLCSITEEKLRQENERQTAEKNAATVEAGRATTPQLWTPAEPEQTREAHLAERQLATAAELDQIDQEIQSHIESELAADSGERSAMCMQPIALARRILAMYQLSLRQPIINQRLFNCATERLYTEW